MLPHVTRLPKATIRRQFPRRLVSRFDDIHWPSRSPDLTPLDYFLWDYLKENLYVETPCTAVELKQSIRRETTAILAALSRGVKSKNVSFQCSEHVKDVVFKSWTLLWTPVSWHIYWMCLFQSWITAFKMCSIFMKHPVVSCPATTASTARDWLCRVSCCNDNSPQSNQPSCHSVNVIRSLVSPFFAVAHKSIMEYLM